MARDKKINRKKTRKTGQYLFVLLFFLLLSLGGCVPVILPEIKPLSKDNNLSKDELKKWSAAPPFSTSQKLKTVPFPSQYVRRAEIGEKNTYDIVVTPKLKAAYDYFLAGLGELALDALKEEDHTSADPGYLWQVSYLRAQVLIMMGKAAEAEIELQETLQREIRYWGHNLNSVALRGQAKLWLEDLEGALQDSASVIKAIGLWQLPTSYLLPPSNMTQLKAVTAAQLQAFTVMAGVYIFKEDYKSALQWATETEFLYNRVHYVNNHPLYGIGQQSYADSFWGRAANLTWLALATAAETGDLKKSNKLFEVASAFYKALGYSAGQATVAALQAKALVRLKKYNQASSAAMSAIKLALKLKLPDYVWRIGIVHGKTLLRLDKKTEAEAAFRRAQASVDVVSGALASDRTKTRFGVGKEDITYHLTRLDVEKKDWEMLFQDMEKGRARAFVDMLANKPVAVGRENRIMSRIQKLDRNIRTQRLQNLSQNQKDTTALKKEKAYLEERQVLINSLQQRDPDLASVLAISTLKLAEVQNKLKSGEMIAYTLPVKSSDPISFLFIRPNSVEYKELTVTAAELQTLLTEFSESMQADEEDSADEDENEERGITLEIIKVSGESSNLQKSATEALQRSLSIITWKVDKILYVVPSGPLHFVPWGIMDIEFPVAVLPTGGWLNRSPRQFKTEKTIVIIGDPEFGDELPQLEGAKQEAVAIGKLYQTQPLLGKAATEANLRRQVGLGTRILHLATHGIYSERDPLDSAVYLTKNGKALAVTARQLFENPIPAKLVILSACETGMGKTVAGEDLLGLVRSFYLGGAVSTLSSLWPIEDEGTRIFMETFHKKAMSGDYGAAWLEARNHVKKLGFPPSVYGAFVLGGAVRGSK